MRAIVTRAQRLKGRIKVPGDKSISHRAVLFGALAKGETRVEGLAPGTDLRSTLECVRTLGVETWQDVDGSWILNSPGAAAFNSNLHLHCGNSGTSARLLLGMLASIPGLKVTLTGDSSLSSRPMLRLAEPLRAMEASLTLSERGTLPATIEGRQLQGRRHALDVASAQVKTGLLLAGLGAQGETWVLEPQESRDHTERLLPLFGVELLRGKNGVGVGSQALKPAHVRVPGDPSAAAFLAAAAALIPNSELIIDEVSINPTRTGAVDVLREFGALIDIPTQSEDPSAPEPYGTWRCRPGPLHPVVIEGDIMPRAIDEIPALCVVATAAKGTTIIREASELRVKESDRLSVLAKGLRAMGAKVDELPDGIAIEGGTPLKGARIDAGGDHRMVMAFTLAGLIAEGETVIDGAEWADVSDPGFFDRLAELTDGAVRVEEQALDLG